MTKIVKSLNRPVTATSANEAYMKKPYQVSDILNTLSEKKKSLIALVIDAGRLPKENRLRLLTPLWTIRWL